MSADPAVVGVFAFVGGFFVSRLQDVFVDKRDAKQAKARLAKVHQDRLKAELDREVDGGRDPADAWRAIKRADDDRERFIDALNNWVFRLSSPERYVEDCTWRATKLVADIQFEESMRGLYVIATVPDS